MSLLMDALKKAELAKRQGQDADPDAALTENPQEGLALEPIQATDGIAPAGPASPEQGMPSPGKLPHLPPHLEELEERFLAEATQAASSRTKAPVAATPTIEPRIERPGFADAAPREASAANGRREPSAQGGPQSKAAAQNLFAAKQTEKPSSRRAFTIAIGVVTFLSVCAIGGYFWWQLQPKTSLIANRAVTPAPARLPPPAALAPTVAVSPAPTFAAAPIAEPGSQTAATGDGATVNADVENAAVVAKAQPRARRPSPAPEPEAPAATESPIRVTKAPLKTDPALMRGFDAFNRGDLTMAQLEYERAQKSDPRNTDALHGLAAIAVRQGHADRADQLYQQITELNPQDTVANAALINSRGQIDPNAAESRLKSLSASQPDLAAPHFSLGNLYARHGRWNDAQQSYFRAYSAEPDNPDILYNLAISLEHLRQNKLAAQYYSQALAAANSRPAGFDRAQATARLRTLRP
ncbi:MAG: tetratricopeptide repeat protein [Burkholderiaceae bacterium]|nr:tetratricopeptide repeat protein [Sulfuritalea sp.]MCF8175653.1 tetratricopeptide repeat protein [Burkholderiaceae bacterium]MCF8184424.1 tetratricopeptide repeat protein [Polynucleobacter sp.]